LEVNRLAVADPKVQEAMDKQIEVWKGTVTRLEKDPKTPQDSMEAILERAKAASEGRELSNHRLEHYELSSGLLQIAIVLASAAIITGIAALIWLSVGLGVIGAALMAFGFLAPDGLAVPGLSFAIERSGARVTARGSSARRHVEHALALFRRKSTWRLCLRR
jgi:hypothetical protein